MKTVIIAEKPSVAREIASVIGATSKHDGYFENKDYIVTWAFGHLVSLAMPEEYGAVGFNREHLPIIPERFILKIKQRKNEKGYSDDAGAKKQLGIIKKVFEECGKIIVATDAGREGELIFRYIFQYLGSKKPFERLWISSLTSKAISEGLQNLKAGSQFDNLFIAAKERSESDWLIGINASQALTIAAGQGTYSLGRVQTPTLAMICKRYFENKNFVSVPYWQGELSLKKDYDFSVFSTLKYDSLQQADSKLKQVYKGGTATLKTIDKKTLNQEAPLLYDLTTLQKEANIKHGFSADKTLSIAQKLYESKYITYPRTGSRYISDDVFEDIPNLIEKLKDYKLDYGFEAFIQHLDLANLNKKSVNTSKVTDHHALLITECAPEKLKNDEGLIYEMVAGRMLEAFAPKCVKERTVFTFDAAGVAFETNCTKIKEFGWRAVFLSPAEEGDDDYNDDTMVHDFNEGDTFEIEYAKTHEKKTKPKPLHTEASLLSEMENAGKAIKNEQERDAIKDSGLGTPATRAAIIETLFKRDYIRKDKKMLIPTDIGLSVYEIVKDKKISDVVLTGEWEKALQKIESGEMDAKTFHCAIEVYARQITSELLNTSVSIAGKSTCTCPKCKVNQVRFYPKVVKCIDENCGLTIFRTKSDKAITDKQINDLLTSGKTGVIKGFKSQLGKSFDAALVFDENYRVIFDFPDKKSKSTEK